MKMRWGRITSIQIIGLLAVLNGSAAWAKVERPTTIVANGVPEVPSELAASARPYLECQFVVWATWNHRDRSMLISTRLGNSLQLHTVASPLAMRRQISFEADTTRAGYYAPGSGDVLIVSKDIGGDERFQLFDLKMGRLHLLTDGKSRNRFGTWSSDGQLIGYSSDRRTESATDLYVMNPRDPKTDRMVLQAKAGGWQIRDFYADGRRALVSESVSTGKTNLYELDLQTQALRPITDPAAQNSYAVVRLAGDGTVWTISDEGADFPRLGKIDPVTRNFTPVSRESKWGVEAFDLSPKGNFVAYVVNEAGISRLMVYDLRTGNSRRVSSLPRGWIPSLEMAPWGEIALVLSGPQTPFDAFSVNPSTLAVSRWTQSETGGLDPRQNAELELVEIKSFDGERVSGFLYRPDPVKFPGKRPMVFDIHGGPAEQERPRFQGEKNYLVNELGIALFFPNVRGSTGFGKRFETLDDGPYKREDSVKDIGAFLNHFAQDPRLDPSRVGVTGGSYGGYMCYASAIQYGRRLRAGICEAAPSSIVTVLEKMYGYRRVLRRTEYGDESDPVQRAKLTAISPLTRSREIKIPLMIMQGANNSRVPQSEAEQMVKAVRANGKDVWYVLGTNEGHGFAKKDNADYYFLLTLMFWQKNLLAATTGAALADPALAGDR